MSVSISKPNFVVITQSAARTREEEEESAAEISLFPVSKNKRPPYWNYTSGFNFDHITAVDMSFCTSLPNFILIGRKMTSFRFSRCRISAILDFRGSISFFEKPMYDFI